MAQRSQRFGRVVRVAPGHIRVTSSTRIYGWIFGGAGVLLAAGAAAAWSTGQELIPVLLLTGMAALFLAVGVLPAWDRISLEIRPEGIDYERRARGAHQRASLPASALQRIRSQKIVRRANNRSVVRYPVLLVFDPAERPEGLPEDLIVFESGSETQARREAEALARDLQLPLEDAVAGEPIVRAPDALDARLEREDDPGLPPPGLGLRPGRDLTGLEVRCGTPMGRTLLISAIVMSLVSSIAAFALLVGFASPDGLPLPVLAIWVLVEIGLAGVLLGIGWLQHYRLAVERDQVVLDRWLGPLRVSRSTLPVAQIEGVRADAAGPLGSGLSILSDDRILTIPHLRPEAAGWLRQWVASRAGA